MSPRAKAPKAVPSPAPEVVLSRGAFISMGLVCTLLSAAFNVGVTWARMSAMESTQHELALRVSACEASISGIRLEEASRLTKLEDGVSEVRSQLAHIDGRLSGVVPAKGRAQ